jgi:exodeoxyribonuclease-3
MPLKLFSWNVNGIRAVSRKGAIQSFIYEYSPDILCLQETKAEKQELPIDFADYQEYWNSATRKGYSGTAVFTKTKPLSVINNFPNHIAEKYDLTHDGYGHPNEEGRVLTAEFDKFYVVTVYTPNSKDDLSRIPLRHKKWDPAFLAHCKELEKKKPIIFCGDLNVAHTEDDLARPKENNGNKGFTKEERSGFQAFVDAGFVDTLRMFKKGNGHYTWWAQWGGARERNVGWRIDYILVSENLKKNILTAEIHPKVLGSDHCPVSITLNI